MNDENKEKLKKAIKGEIRSFSREPFVIRNENPLWVMECARVLGPRFAFVAVGKETYHITISAERMYELLDDLDLLFSQSKFEYYAHEALDGMRKELGEAHLRCEAIIQCFQNKAQDERKALEERLHLEAEIRYGYQNRRY